MAKNKGIKTEYVVILLAVVVGLVLYSTGNLSGILPGAITQPAQVGEVVLPTDTGLQCDVGTADAITMQVFSVAPDGVKTDVTGDYNYEFYDAQSGAYVGTTTGTTAINLSKLESYTVHAFDAGGAHDVYYFNANFATGCEASEVVILEEGTEDTAISTAVYSLSGSTETANTETSLVAVGAGGTVKGRLYAEATTANGSWSTANGGRKVAVVFDYNATVYKQPEIVRVSSGTVSAPTTAPNAFSNVQSSSTQEVMYIISTDALTDLGDIEIDFQAETRTASINPTQTDGNIGMTILDFEGYKNDQLNWVVGIEDADDGTYIGETAVTDSIHVS